MCVCECKSMCEGVERERICVFGCDKNTLYIHVRTASTVHVIVLLRDDIMSRKWYNEDKLI